MVSRSLLQRASRQMRIGMRYSAINASDPTADTNSVTGSSDLRHVVRQSQRDPSGFSLTSSRVPGLGVVAAPYVGAPPN